MRIKYRKQKLQLILRLLYKLILTQGPIQDLREYDVIQHPQKEEATPNEKQKAD